MDTGEDVFREVMAATPRRVARLADGELHQLIGYLGRNLDVNGRTGELMGVCLEESVARLAPEKEDLISE